MTLNIRTEEDERRQLKVVVEVAEERVQAQMQRTARQLSSELSIPGFRKGKVPYNVLVQRIGREALRSEAVEELLNPVVEETLAEVDVTPFAQISVDDLDMEPLVVYFTIPMEPVVNLGDYRAIRREVTAIEVADEAVQDALEHLRTHHQVLEPVNRPAMEGDVVAISGTGEIIEADSTEVIMDEERVELLMDAESTFPGTDFVANLIGMEVGDDGEFSIRFPEEYEEAELAGREATFSITVLDVKSRYLPELNDELAKEEGDYETLDELRDALREELRQQAEAQARNDLFDGFMDEMAESAEVLFPPVLVEDELAQTLESLKNQTKQSGWEWQDYMTLQSESEESLKEGWREEAEQSVKRGLMLRELVRREKLTLSEAELDEAVEKRLERFSENEELRQQLRDIFRQGPGLESIANDLMMDRVFERIEAIVTGNAPDLAALEAAEREADEAAGDTTEEE